MLLNLLGLCVLGAAGAIGIPMCAKSVYSRVRKVENGYRIQLYLMFSSVEYDC